MIFAPDDPLAFEVVNPRGRSRVFLICDHASNRVPRGFDNLGLTPAQLLGHISWDPGAAEVARHLSLLLDAPLVLSGYSRLVIDCNRPLTSDELIAKQSAGIAVPGNQILSEADQQTRINYLFEPYHTAINNFLDQRQTEQTLLFSIHSFTPVLRNQQRPWHVGVSHKESPKLAQFLYHQLTLQKGIQVGFNQPYAIDDEFDYSIPIHGDKRGLESVMIEIRQDGLRNQVDSQRWAVRLADAYNKMPTTL